MRAPARRTAWLAAAVVLAGCSPESRPLNAPRLSRATAASGAFVTLVVDVSKDTTAQNETPIGFNPIKPGNLITGANDWNYNDGCAVNASFDGGQSWTPTLPNGFLPGVTRFTNDPRVPGTGVFDAGGDPAIAFGPDGTAYYACQGFNFTSPFAINLLLSRSTDGGRTWLRGGTAEPLTVIATWNGNGKTRGSNGQFTDHDAIWIDRSPASPFYGSIYVTWAQFDGVAGTHSPVYVAVSRDRGRTFSAPVKVPQGPIRNNQDQRIVTGPDGAVYLTFDNGVQGGKGTVNYVAASHDGGVTWSTPLVFYVYTNPVCIFPSFCFNIPLGPSGTPFRGPGSYPAPAFDALRDRLDVVFADIVGGRARIYFTSAPASDLTQWSTPVEIAPGTGDRFGAELSVAPNGRLDAMFDDRSYSGNALVDVTYTSSTDGGVTWQATRVSATGFDPGASGVPDAASSTGLRPFIGDYNGIAALSGRAVMTWTGIGPRFGALNDNLEIFFGSVTP
jgi:hypothetical protein